VEEEDLSEADSYRRVARTEEETRRVGAELAGRIAPGDVVLLVGDLGSGKTTFVRGLAEGLGAEPLEVASPTFSLVHEYPVAGRSGVSSLVHVDLYRLSPQELERDVESLGVDEAIQRNGVVAIEWPRPPFDRESSWRVEIQEAGDGSRVLEISRHGLADRDVPAGKRG
jgi:tRNA threonylcarbamoyladenosine biosynthesis protein TsaE